MAKRKCYGYDVGPDGELAMNSKEAQVMYWIFEQYPAGNSLGKLHLVWKGKAFPPPLAGPN